MPRICSTEGCNNPIWSRKSGKCKFCIPKTKKPLKKAKQIAKISTRRKTERQIYNVKRRMFLEQNPMCQIYPDKKATEIHHIRGTNNGRLLDEKYWMALSREAHNYVHANPSESYEKGWLIKRNAK